jgi:AcrR family transcriptional regulator
MSATPEAPAERPLRRDAERNRQRIIDAARIVFAERGLRGSHDDIAREAGVGVGTVYRRFPDKEQLIDALFEERMEEFAGFAEAGLAIEDPWDGLVHFMLGTQELQCEDRGLKEIVHSTDHGADRVARARERVEPLITRLLARAQEAGAVRADLALTDIPMMQSAVAAVADTTSDLAPDLWRRALTLMLDGIRADRAGNTPFVTPALTLDELQQAMHAAHAPK